MAKWVAIILFIVVVASCTERYGTSPAADRLTKSLWEYKGR